MADDFDKKWEAFEARCKACHNCGLRDGCTNVVIYRGSSLQNLLGSYGFTNNDYHICNIAKCRPPQNRRPTPEEIHCCKPLLAEQFMLVRPKVILLCGSTAYEGFFGTKPVMHDVRGRFIEKNGYYIMTTYHPAYALRNPANKMPIYEDMGKVRDKLTEIGAMPPLEPVKE